MWFGRVLNEIFIQTMSLSRVRLGQGAIVFKTGEGRG